jgi:ComF family protein
VTPVIHLIPNPQSLIPWVAGIADAVTTALLAPVCAVCGVLLDEPLSGCVCGSCWRSVVPITPPLCDRCGDPLARPSQSPIPTPQSLCAPCCASNGAVSRARAIGEYEGTLREIIHALKYSGRYSLSRPLAELMRRRGRELLEDVDCVVPVPLHWRREYQRGFNQAREIARHLGRPVANVLVRCRATRAQVELAADRRRANVAGAFMIRRGWFRAPSIRGKKLLLIDDVSTTGATLESCAGVLKESGASEVFALTAARVVTRRRVVPYA